MRSTEILKDLSEKKYLPLYFLHGPEEYYINLISDYILQNALKPRERAFNQTILYGKETSTAEIFESASRYPIMSERRLVIVREAQYLNFAKISKDIKDPVNRYISRPYESTILVFCHKNTSIDGRLSIVKTIQKTGLVFESKKLYDAQLPSWINSYLSAKNLRIDPRACAMIAEYLGTDLSRVSKELDKMMVNMPENYCINISDVENNIGISKDYNVFELQNALGRKDIFKANAIILYFSENKRRNPSVVTINSLINYFTKLFVYHEIKNQNPAYIASVLKMNSFFINDYRLAAENYSCDKVYNIISLLREYDLKLKGVESNTDEAELVRELIWHIMH